MLNKRVASLFFLGAIFLGSCTQKVSDVPLYGLIEGTYYYQSQEGTAPDGWSFSDESYFEFKQNPSGKSSDPDWLPDGNWDMQKYVYIDKSHRYQYLYEYIMEWHNTPFDSLSSMRPRAYESDPDNTVYVPMYTEHELNSEIADSNWRGIINVYCYITPLQKNDYSKRKLMVKCYYSDLSTFSITFSM